MNRTLTNLYLLFTTPLVYIKDTTGRLWHRVWKQYDEHEIDKPMPLRTRPADGPLSKPMVRIVEKGDMLGDKR